MQTALAIAIPLALILSLAGLLAWRALVGKRLPGYLARTEYWVYTTQTKLPPQERLMDRMISSNPHNQRGNPCIGAREGLLFTDVRLHLAVALREKNATLFRPDLFQEDVQPTPETLAALAESTAIVKVRYVSEARLPDTRHLQFLPHMADAVASLMDGRAVFDHTAERLVTAQDFHQTLADNNRAERPEFHVRVLWKNTAESHYAHTRGLRKIGLRDLRTQDQEPDHQTLVSGLLMRLAFHLVRKPEENAGPWEFEDFGDKFVFARAGRDDQFDIVSLQRRQTLPEA